MVQRGLSGSSPMDVILTPKKSLETRSEDEPLKIVTYKKIDANGCIVVYRVLHQWRLF